MNFIDILYGLSMLLFATSLFILLLFNINLRKKRKLY